MTFTIINKYRHTNHVQLYLITMPNGHTSDTRQPATSRARVEGQHFQGAGEAQQISQCSPADKRLPGAPKTKPWN